MLKTSPFHARTSALMEGQAWRRWSGYTMASAYELTHEREYAAIRSAAALFDISPLCKYAVTGKDAARLLDRIVTRDVARAAIGQVLYTPWCDAHGKVIDDGTIARLGEDVFRMTAAEPSLRWLTMNAEGLDVAIEEVTESLAALALQGPLARTILAEAAEGRVADLNYFRIGAATIAGVDVTISRTGYTGDLGYEIWIPTEGALAVWDALVAVGARHQLAPAGVWALDVARIEAGLVMADVDYVSAHRALVPSQMSSPLELGLGWAVSVEKGPYVGKKALVAEKARGPAWQFVGIDVDWESLEREYAAVGLPPRLPSIAWRESIPLYAEGRQIGFATSGCFSPLLKKLLALAHVEAPWAKVGTALEIEITVEHRRKRALAHVAKLPFFEPARKKGAAK